MKRVIAVLALTLVLPGCAYRLRDPVTPLVGPPVTEIPTPYGEALACLGRDVKDKRKFTVGVGAIVDKSGKFSLDDGGYKVPQGPDLMAVSALAKTHAVQLVERSDTRVIEWELKYANDKVLGDGPRTVQTAQGPQEVRYRGIYPGSLTGSDYYVVGAVTSVDYNVFSGGVQASAWGIGGGYREFRLLIGVDLHLVDTRSSTIRAVSSLQKQVVGYEIETNVFKFFGSVLVNYDGGTKVNEPLSVGVRSVIERAVFDMVSDLYGIKDGECRSLARQAELTVAGDSSGAAQAKADAEKAAATKAATDKASDDTGDTTADNADATPTPSPVPAAAASADQDKTGAVAAPVPGVAAQTLAAPAAPDARAGTLPDGAGSVGNNGAAGVTPAADNAAGANPTQASGAAAKPVTESMSGAAPAGAVVGEAMPPGATSAERPVPGVSALEPAGRTQSAAARPDAPEQPATNGGPTQ